MSFTKSPKYQGKIRTCIIQVCLNYCFGEIFSIVPGISHPPLIELIRVTKEWMIQLGDAKARTWLLGWPQRIHPSSTSWHDNCGVFLMFFLLMNRPGFLITGNWIIVLVPSNSGKMKVYKNHLQKNVISLDGDSYHEAKSIPGLYDLYGQCMVGSPGSPYNPLQPLEVSWLWWSAGPLN